MSISKPTVEIDTSSQNTPTTHNDYNSDSSISSDNTASWADTELVEPHVGYKKVLVTGGAGFIGSSVADHLLRYPTPRSKTLPIL